MVLKLEQPVTSLASIFIIPIAYLTLILVIAFTINIMDKLGKDIECEKKVKMKDVLTRTQILSFPGYLINFTPGKISLGPTKGVRVGNFWP